MSIEKYVPEHLICLLYNFFLHFLSSLFNYLYKLILKNETTYFMADFERRLCALTQ